MKDNYYKLIFIPQLGVNDQTIKIARWYVKNESKVKIGDLICGVESTKTAYEVESEYEGNICFFYEEGEELEITEPAAVVFKDIETLKKLKPDIIGKYKKSEAISPAVTSKALKKAIEFGIDISLITKKGIIKEIDIEEFHLSQNVQKIDLSEIKLDKIKTNIVIYGSGKGAYTVYEALSINKEFNVICYIDDNFSRQGYKNGIPVIYSKTFFDEFNYENIKIASGVSQIDSKKILKLCNEIKISLINVIHPYSYISPTVETGIGNFIKAGAIVETNTVIKNCCQIDNSVTVAHDCIIESYSHLAPGATLGSSILIGEGSVIGIGSTVSTGVKIGKYCIVSVGSSVTCDIPDYSIVEGVPAKIIGKRK